MRPNDRSGARTPGFTMVEILFALVIVGVLVGMAMPGITSALTGSRVDNAAAIVASDLRLAFSLAARQGRPVRIAFDAGADMYRITDRASGDLLHSRWLGAGSEFQVEGVAFSATPIDVFPKRVASTGLTVTLTAGPAAASVEMSSAGHIEVDRP